MIRKNITSGSYLEEPIGFSRAVRMGNLIAVSATAPIEKNNAMKVGNNLYDQSIQCLQIIKEAIEEAGGKLENVIRTRVYLTEIKDWRQAAKAHGQFFTKIRPACTFVQVKGFIDPDWLIEIEADCVLD